MLAVTAPADAATVYEGAENGLARVTVRVPADYNVLSSTVYADPKAHAFHMGHIGFSPEDQWLMLNAAVVPQAGTELLFKSRLAWSGSGESAHVQVSVGGGPWLDTAFSQQGTDTAGESGFNSRVLSLQPFAGQTIRIRFYYRYTFPGNSLSYVSDSIGWFIDQIAVVTDQATVLSEGAENGLETVTAQVPAGYTHLFSSTVFADPPFHSFHLAHIGFTPIDPWVMLNSPVVPQAGSRVQFQSRLGWSGSGESAHVQVSVEGGPWLDTQFAQQGSDTAGESVFNARTLSLESFVGQTIRIRFYYRYTSPGNSLSYASDSIGWFIDQIAVTNVLEATPKADFDSDGRADVLWRNAATGQNTVWLFDAQGGVTAAGLPPVADGSWRIGAAGDFDGDQRTDILWRNVTTGENVIWRMNGTAVIAQVALPPVFDLNWQIRGAADFDGDGKLDILWRNTASGADVIWKMTVTSVASAVGISSVSDLNWEIGAAADFDGDGKPDILWRNGATGQNTIWRMNGTSVAELIALPYVADPAWQISGAGDFTGDGQTDILWRNGSTGADTVWQMSGTTPTRAFALPPVSNLDWRIAGPR